jgi:hypothetical protein
MLRPFDDVRLVVLSGLTQDAAAAAGPPPAPA